MVKIADFGFAKKVNGELDIINSSKGTPMTMAPQVLEGVPYTNKADIYSLGATLYYMLFKTYPYNAQSWYKLVDVIKNGELPSFNHNGVVVDKEVIIIFYFYKKMVYPSYRSHKKCLIMNLALI